MAPTINIPLDALTSRLNIGAVTEGFRSQSMGARFANLRPVSEFFDFKRLSKPNDFGEIQSRVNYNLGYFASNYLVVTLMLCLYSLLNNFWLLFDIIFVSAGLFIIRKLNGRDLELGFTRLTTSQLYTGLLIIGVPIFFFSGPLATLLWLVGANGCAILGHASFMDKPIDQAFSEEGGSSRSRKEWERQQREWEHTGRFEELDSDSDDDQGVDLEHAYKSDELHFTGGDIGPRRRYKRRSGYEEYSEDSELDDDLEDEDETQLALRVKEDVLVERALERIRRAQALGKTNVKLTAAESDALERKMAKDQVKGRKPVLATKKIGESSRKSSKTNLRPANKRKSSRSSLDPSRDTDPSMTLVPSSSRPGSRSNSSQSLQTQPPLQPRNARRLVSDPEPQHSTFRYPPMRHALPDDPNWQPRSRSSSAARPPYPVSSQDYAAYPTPAIPTQYASSSRRNVSGPAELGYADPYADPYARQLPVHMPSVRGYQSSSDPSLARRRRGGGGFDGEDEDEDEEEDEASDQGVQVDVQASGSPQGYEINVARPGQRFGNASATSSARSRRGKR